MELSNGVGRPSMLIPKYVAVIMDALHQAYCVNDRYLQRESINMVQKMHGVMRINKSSRQLTQNSINNSGWLVKRWAVKSQKTTTKLCAITMTQQYLWNKATEPLYSFLRN